MKSSDNINLLELFRKYISVYSTNYINNNYGYLCVMCCKCAVSFDLDETRECAHRQCNCCCELGKLIEFEDFEKQIRINNI
jgi:hypothetical protein